MKRQTMMLLGATVLLGWQMTPGIAAQNQNNDAVPDILSEEQREALVAERPESDGAVTRINTRARQHQRLTADQRQNHIEAGTIPFQITADVFQVNADGRRGARANGNIVFYVLDEDENVVDAGTRTVRQMCPT